MNTPITAKTVFVVEDSALLRARLVEMIGEIPGVHIVGEASSPIAAIAGIVRTLPHFVVLDYQLDGGTGVEVLHSIRVQCPDIKFIVLTNYSQPQVRRVCIEAGAHAFFDKSTEMDKVRVFIANFSYEISGQ